MEYLLSFLLLGLNLYNCERPVNTILFFVIGSVLFFSLLYVCYKKTNSFLCTCLMLFCHTWQISWINIFGKPSVQLQLPWFYIIGVMLVCWALLNIKRLAEKNVNSTVLAVFFCTFVLLVYPVFMSKSKSEGLKELLMIGFFLVLVFIAMMAENSVEPQNRRNLASSFIFAVVISCVFIIIQFMYYSFTGNTVFNFSVGIYNGNTMNSALLLMEDPSCATIMLGCGVFYMLERLNKNNWFIYGTLICITVIGLALTTRRTSVVSLVVVLIAYVIFHYKGTMKKTVMLAVIGGIIAVMISYLLIARPVDDMYYIISENGRFEYYINSLAVFLKHPFGIGYDNTYLAQTVGGVVPHNTVLRWLVMCGFPFTLCMIIILGYLTVKAYRKHMMTEFWIILYTLFASNFIPDILNARFFVIPCMAVFVIAADRTESERTGLIHEKNTYVPSRNKLQSRM